MKTLSRFALVLALVFGWSATQDAASAQDATANLSITISGLDGSEGQVLVALFKSEKSWLKVPKAERTLKKKITGKDMKVDFKGLPAGTYGVLVVHDADKNNKLNMRWLPFPKPKEGVGVSNNAPFKKAPEWSTAKFELPAGDKALAIKLKYP